MNLKPGEGDHKHRKLDKMRRQRNMLQPKKHDKNSQDQVNEKKQKRKKKKKYQRRE